MNKEQEISRRKQNHKTQTISDCPIQEAQQEVWWGTSFAKYELLFSPLIYFNFYPKITMPLKKNQKNLFEWCRDVCVPSASGRKGVKHKSSQQSGQQLLCRDATCWKLKETWSHTHIPAWKKPNKKDKSLDLPWESSFSSCHSESLPRRRRCHLDCWGLREGWFWMVTRSHHGSVSVCPAVWNSAAPSFAGKTWVWRATGNGGEGVNDHRTSCIFTPLSHQQIQWGSHSTELSKQPESGHGCLHVQEAHGAARLHHDQQFNHPIFIPELNTSSGVGQEGLAPVWKKFSQDLGNSEAGDCKQDKTNQPTTSIWDKEQPARRNWEAVRASKKHCQHGCLWQELESDISKGTRDAGRQLWRLLSS